MQRRSKTATHKDHGPVMEHIPNLITLYKDNHVERPATIPHLHPSSTLHLSLTCRDHLIDPTIHLWARLYLPKHSPNPNTRPTLIYFHGGGFCVGSASWSIYHHFLSRTASFLSCSILSVNYHLAPEHPLPAAYEDGLSALKWARQQKHLINADKIFLSGDSAGANVAYNTALSLADMEYVRGVVLFQPFFGSERRTWTEMNLNQGVDSALSLSTSDCYWRMALPHGTDRDHEYCNPIGKKGVTVVVGAPMMVCVAELDILRDGNLEFCEEIRRRGGDVECVVYNDVGHAFQVLGGAAGVVEVRTQMLLNDIKSFVNKHF